MSRAAPTGWSALHVSVKSAGVVIESPWVSHTAPTGWSALHVSVKSAGVVIVSLGVSYSTNWVACPPC